MKLIELSFFKETSEEVKTLVYRFASSLDDKKIIEIPNIQGFIVNRLLFAYINYSIKFYFENALDAETIDSAMKLGTNNPMGPLELSDYIGNDITLDILQEFYNSTKDIVYKPNENFVKMVENFEFGKKVKKGFYRY